MTPAASNPTLFRRVAHVSVVALLTASSLALLGAIEAPKAVTIPPAMMSAADADRPDAAAAEEMGLPQLASFRVRPTVQSAIGRFQDALAALPAAGALPRTRVVRMEVTAYCPCTRCCGPAAQGITASGKLVTHNDGKFVAADTSVLPFGTKIVVPGYADEQAVEVIDRGGAIKGNKLDLYFDNHADALIWGRQHLNVVVYE